MERTPGPLRQQWGATFVLLGLLAVALALRLHGIDWDEGHGFHPDERSFYMRAGDMLCLLTAGPDQDGPYCSAPHLRSLLAGEHLEGIEPGLPSIATALSAERSPLNPRWFPLGSILIYVLVLLRTLLEPFTDWGVMELRFVGRALAALADTAAVGLIYLIGRRMYGQWTGILAAAFVTFAVIHIQHAHYYRPEPFTVLTSLGALWAMLRFIETRQTRHGILLGALVGLAMAPKVSVAPILAPLILTFLWVAKDRAGRGWSQLRPLDVARIAPVTGLAGLAAVAAFFITTPYAFLDFANFIGDIREQAGMAGDAGRFPFTWQYADTPAFLYQIRQTAVWGLGLPLGIAAWVAAPVTAWFAWRGGVAQRADLLLLAWAVPGFVFLELFEVRFLRYVFPLMPFYLLMAARMLTALIQWAGDRRRPPEPAAPTLPDDAPFSEEWHATPPTVGDDLIFDEPIFGDDPFPDAPFAPDSPGSPDPPGSVAAPYSMDAPFSEEWHATPPTAGVPVAPAPLVPAPAPPAARGDAGRWPAIRAMAARYAQPAAIALLVLILGATVWYAVAFSSVYGRPHPALVASQWINDNVPPGAAIINGGSYWDEQIPSLGDYKVWTFAAYHPDHDRTKIPDLIDRLAKSDYLVFYSNRAYGSVSRLPQEYPQSSAVFRLLFAGELGYQLERAFTSYPSLAGVNLRDDPYGRAGLPAPGLAPEGDAGRPAGLTINLGYADENVVGYDHPQPLVFRNVERLYARELRERIFAAVATESDAGASLMLSPPTLAAQQAGGTWSDLFHRDGWASRVPWLSWLLVIELFCLAAFPLTWWLFRPLPDRGVLLARALGLLLVAWFAWWATATGLLPYSNAAIWLALLLVAGLSAIVLWRQWRALLAWLARRWRFILTAELLFLLAYLAFTLIRAANPDLWHPWRGGEKPMEMAYLTAVARSSALPPYDPWFSGGYLNYYYWGYSILSAPLRLTGLPPAIGFNVAVPMLFALTATGAGSLVYNLVALARGTPRPAAAAITANITGTADADADAAANAADARPGRRALARRWLIPRRLTRFRPGGAGIAAVGGGLMAAVLGNLDGAVQLLEIAGRKVQGMHAPWSHFDFWRSSRAIPNADEGFAVSLLTPWLSDAGSPEQAGHITEFPYFTFLFADLHPHMITMPFALLAVALAFALVAGLGRSGTDWTGTSWTGTMAGIRHIARTPILAAWPWAVVATLAVAVGSLWAINSWEYPAYALLMLAAIAGGALLLPGSLKARLAMAAVFGAAALALSYLAFQPFHAAIETFGTGIEPTRWRTPLSSYLLIHALPLLATGALLTATLPRAWAMCRRDAMRRLPSYRRSGVGGQWLIAAAALGLLAAAYFWAAGFVTVGMLVILLTLTGLALAAALASPEYPQRRPDLMALLMLAMALALGIGVDLIRVEGDIARMNTVFKYYLVAWLLFAASGTYGLWRGWTATAPGAERPRQAASPAQAGIPRQAASPGLSDISGQATIPRRTGIHRQISIRRLIRWVAAGVVALVIAGTAVYPALATPVRIADRFNPLPLTLDGAAYQRSAQYHPPEWCAEGKTVDPFILQADQDAIRWLQENVAGSPVVLEGHGLQYCWNTRISQYTGLPTVLGWPWHQQQQRNDHEAVIRRGRDVATIYNTLSRQRAAELLDEYDVAYIVIGHLERGYYGARGIAKFQTMAANGTLTLAYTSEGATIYRVTER